jgi:hypothetical protein
MGKRDITEARNTVGVVTRRLGRVASQDANIRELLRRAVIGEAPTDLIEVPIGAEGHPLAPARGVLLGCVIGGAIWAVTGLGIRLLF